MNRIATVLFLIYIQLAVSCKHKIKTPVENNETQTLIKNDSINVKTEDIFFLKLKLYGSDSAIDKMPIKKAAIYLAHKYYNEITNIDFIDFIDAVYKYKTKIEGYGNLDVVEVNIKGKSLSNATPKKCYLMYCKEKKDAFIFNFSKLILVKHKVSDTANIVGGIVITKGIGYFLNYSFKNSSFVKTFDSGFDVDENTIAIPVYLNNEGCIKYDGDFLKFKNTDLNHDGLLDFSFYGTVLHYCNPKRDEISHGNNQLINSQNIKINYLQKNLENKLAWVLSDTTEIKQVLDIR